MPNLFFELYLDYLWSLSLLWGWRRKGRVNPSEKPRILRVRMRGLSIME